MYERITDENPYQVPMRIYPAIHYTMGGLWVDYDLMTTIPGLYAIGEANFSDHGANRLGASALMQGLADGYFVLPYTIGNYLAGAARHAGRVAPTHPAFKAAEAERRDEIAPVATSTSRAPSRVDYFHRELGKIMWDYCGMDRNKAGLEKALSEIPALYERVQDATSGCSATADTRQPVAREGRPGRRLLRARRADVPRRPRARGELRRPLPGRAPDRGGRGAARRRALRLRRGLGVDRRPSTPQMLHKEPLEFEYVHLTQRSYK